MATNNTGSIQTLAGGAGAGAFLDVQSYATPRQYRYKGAIGDKVLIEGSSTGDRASEILTRTVTSNDEGAAFVLTDFRAFPFVRVTVLEGNSRATATTTVTAEPLAGNLPNAAFTVGNDATPSGWIDLRALGTPRTLMYEGFAGDEVLIEGSDTGIAGSEYPILERGGAAWAVQDDALPNYGRITRLAGTTPGARAGVAAMPNSGAAGGDVINGGQKGAVSVFSTDSVTTIGGPTVTPGTTTLIRSGGEVSITAPDNIAIIGDDDVSIVAGNDASGTASIAAPTILLTPNNGVGVGGAPHATALLDLTSTSKGLGLPNMTTAQRNAIPGPKPGLLVWDTDLAAPCWWNTTHWVFPVFVFATNNNTPSIADGGSPVVVTNYVTPVQNIGAAFNATTGVFTAPFVGNFRFVCKWEFAAIAAIINAEFTASIAVNGTGIASNETRNQVAALSQPRSVLVAAEYRLAQGDTVTFRAGQNSGSGAVLLTGNSMRNYVSISVAR